jgi:hypothetical protein
MTKEIILSRGKVALVDDEDYNKLKVFKWFAHPDGITFYAYRKNPQKIPSHLKMHQVIMASSGDLQVDHIDGDGLNNQRANLRLVTNRENCQNRHVQTSNKYPGVQKYTGNLTKPYRAKIYVKGRQKHIGFFKTEEDAAIAYRVACAVLEPLRGAS